MFISSFRVKRVFYHVERNCVELFLIIRNIDFNDIDTILVYIKKDFFCVKNSSISKTPFRHSKSPGILFVEDSPDFNNH